MGRSRYPDRRGLSARAQFEASVATADPVPLTPSDLAEIADATETVVLFPDRGAQAPRAEVRSATPVGPLTPAAGGARQPRARGAGSGDRDEMLDMVAQVAVEAGHSSERTVR